MKLIAAKLLLLTAFMWCSSVSADTFTILCKDIDYPVTIVVPDGFTLAKTQSEIARRDRNLSYHNDNKGIRGTYSEVFRSKWSDVGPFPVIFVSTLGTTRAAQGKITESAWENLRTQFENLSREKIKEYRNRYQPKIRENMPYKDFQVQDELSWASGDYQDKAVIMSRAEFSVNGTSYKELGARTINYIDGYLIVLDFKIDATQPNSMESLKSWVENTTIASVAPEVAYLLD